MKSFLYKVLLFISPFVIWMVIEAFLPVTTFTYRHYEAVDFITHIPHENYYYPNLNSRMIAVGDLCHHTKNAIPKEETWKTDKLGFRNDAFIEQADIVLVGDSFIQGSGLCQQNILSNKIKSKSGNKIKTYNIAPGNMYDFDKLIKQGIIKKPKLLIFSIVERYDPAVLLRFKRSVIKEDVKSIFGTFDLNVYLDKAFRAYSLDFFRARMNDRKGKGIPGIEGSNMFFMTGRGQQQRTAGKIAENAEVILSYKKYCDASGIKFLFLPMPDKETVYYDLVPFAKQPDYLFRLDTILRKSNIKTINTVQIYNDYRRTGKTLLYNLDDTHWNASATDLIAGEIIKQL